MSWILDFYRSALGKKVVMAVTGVIAFGWVFLHMFGNLKMYLGEVPMNHYAEWLRVAGAPLLPPTVLLWVTRVVVLIAIWLHIQAATQLTLMNWAARPTGYKEKKTPAATYAALTMRWSGVFIVIFVIYHVMHLTLGTTGLPFVEGKPYENVVAGFRIWWVSLFYIAANILLGFHLYHGLWSMFQSVGLNNPRFNAWRRWFATAFAVIIAAGNISFPVAVMLGIVR